LPVQPNSLAGQTLYLTTTQGKGLVKIGTKFQLLAFQENHSKHAQNYVISSMV